MDRHLFVSSLPGAWSPHPAFHRWLRLRLARALRQAGWHLARSGRRLAADAAPAHRGSPPPDDLPLLEFHADAGAPEGALYVNGTWVGRLEIDRL